MIAHGLGSAWLPFLLPASPDLPSLKGFQPFPASYRKQVTSLTYKIVKRNTENQ